MQKFHKNNSSLLLASLDDKTKNYVQNFYISVKPVIVNTK